MLIANVKYCKGSKHKLTLAIQTKTLGSPCGTLVKVNKLMFIECSIHNWTHVIITNREMQLVVDFV